MSEPMTSAALEELVREHAALRRVATLVARQPSPSEVFAAVTREVGMLLGAQRATLLRVDSAEWAVVAAAWSDGTAPPVPVGHRGALDGQGIVGRMLVDPRPVRVEDFDEVGGVVAELMRELGIRRGAGGPIILGGRVWGAVTAVWPADVAMPPGAEHRVAAFAELVSYAIENAETRAELAASRARLVETADEARRRIERDLHDGAQQQFVAAALELTLLQQRLARDPDDAQAVLTRVRDQLDRGLGELRDLARGIHPTVLTERGLEAALKALVQRARHPAGVGRAGRPLVVTVADDGIGGADPTAGSGLRGLVDRVNAVGGRLELDSVRGHGTRLCARLPMHVLGSLDGHERLA
jgi:signal transduction histidine kinase